MTSLGEMSNLVGKRILIVDEVDDTRTTLEYAVKELEKDVEAARQRLGGDQPKTEFSIFVLHVGILPLRIARTFDTNLCVLVEQGQGQEGRSASRHGRRGPLPRCAHCR
jgi:hypothetical protein